MLFSFCRHVVADHDTFQMLAPLSLRSVHHDTEKIQARLQCDFVEPVLVCGFDGEEGEQIVVAIELDIPAVQGLAAQRRPRKIR